VSNSVPPTGAVRLLEMVADHPVGHVEHRARYGSLPLRGFGGPRGPMLLADTAARARLTGRGGAGFPLATKLRAVATQPRGPAVVVANGAEGEPASRKDRTLLGRVPHLVLDGAVLAADAVGADTVHVCVHPGPAVAVVTHAVAERGRAGVDPVFIQVHEVPGRYVASQETALIGWLGGGPALPTFTPPRPSERGVRGRPTLVSNVETLAQLALLARYGERWYAEVGTPEAPGSVLLTVGGAVARPAVQEVAYGTRLGTVLDDAGAGGLAAVLLGGYFGSWLPMPDAGDLEIAPETLRAAGAALGAGVILALPRGGCGLADTARIVTWLADQNAGQCGPCVNGLPAIAGALDALAAGRADRELVHRLRHWLTRVERRGACQHPDGVARLVRSTLQVFDAEVQRHLRGDRCAPGGSMLPSAQRRSA